jgi:hypothetical protein
MSSDNSLETRLAFLRIDQTTRATLREMAPLLAKVLPDVLDGFYALVSKFPETAKFFRNPEHMRHAKEMQLKHWSVITAAEFSDTYVQSVTRIGETHNRWAWSRAGTSVGIIFCWLGRSARSRSKCQRACLAKVAKKRKPG